MYSKAKGQAMIRYSKKSQHRVTLTFKTEDYEKLIQPYVEASGKPVSTFIKEAIFEKIEREQKTGTR